jgi:hypothetical protein
MLEAFEECLKDTCQEQEAILMKFYIFCLEAQTTNKPN